MEIRGSGALFGYKQSGGSGSVGYEMYTRLVQNYLHDFHHQGGTVLMVTHQLELGLELATRVLVLGQQRIQHDISAEELNVDQCSTLLEE